jgi:hypothetical protein
MASIEPELDNLRRHWVHAKYRGPRFGALPASEAATPTARCADVVTAPKAAGSALPPASGRICLPKWKSAVAPAVTDAHSCRLLAAVRDRVTYPQEDRTLEIVVTDHGHRDDGGRSGLETRGPGLAAGAPDRERRHEDVAVQVLASLGRTPNAELALGARRAGPNSH